MKSLNAKFVYFSTLVDTGLSLNVVTLLECCHEQNSCDLNLLSYLAHHQQTLQCGTDHQLQYHIPIVSEQGEP